MNQIQDMLSQINIEYLIKVFNIQIAIAIFLVFFIFRGIFSRIIIKIFFLITKNKKDVKNSKLYKIFYNFFIFVGLYLAIRIFKLNAKTMGVINSCFKIICIIFITNVINSFVTADAKWFRKYISYSKNDVINKLICRLIKGFIWIISIYIIIKELGYDLTGLVAGFGIGSVIISLAAQDTVKSLLSGAIILTDKPFELGDYIAVGSHEGTVEDITFRSTRIRARDNTVITIPNSTVTSEYVVNWNRLNSRKFECVLNLSMDTSLEKIQDIIQKIKLVLKTNPDVLEDTIQVNFSEIASYSADILIFLYINKTTYIDYLNVKEKILCQLLELVEMENIELAYPTQTLYFKSKGEKIEEFKIT